jgi:hypothetical protein
MWTSTGLCLSITENIKTLAKENQRSINHGLTKNAQNYEIKTG